MEILFKGIELNTKKWKFGDYIKRHISRKEFVSFIKDVKGIPYNVDPNTICQFTGITDSGDIKIFGDDLRIAEDGVMFRIYSVPGGFAIKAPHWMSDTNDLDRTDELILSPIADPQTKSWLINSTKHFGNIHEKTSS